MRPAIFPPHRQGVEHDCRKRAGHSSLKENVACGDRKGAFAMARSERCSKSKCIEMTAMIRDEHKRPVRGQLFTAGNFESMCDGEISSQERKTSVVREALEQAAFASHAAEALCWSQAGVTRWLKLPGVHRF